MTPDSSEVSCSLSSPEKTIKSQGASTSTLSKVLSPERQSWLDLANNTSAGEEVDSQSSVVSSCSQDTDYPMTDSNKAMESRLLKPESSFQNSLSEDASSLVSSKNNLSVSGTVGRKTLSKGESLPYDDSVCGTGSLP